MILHCFEIEILVQAMNVEDDRLTSQLYSEGGSNYTTISSLAWRYLYYKVTPILPS